jgi:hypothetical protein
LRPFPLQYGRAIGEFVRKTIGFTDPIDRINV